VPAEAKDRLFQPFTQLDPAARMKGGVGLGLSLSRRLAEALGGNVTLAASSPGNGSTFVVKVDAGVPTAPAGEAEASGAVPDAGSPQALAGLTLLLVEDYPDIQDMIRRFVEDTGLSLLAAETGLDGVELALARAPDLVLMDLQLPKMDGMKATSVLRGKGFKAPIIAMTAHAMKGQQQACLDAGFDDFISKPLSREELLGKLRRFAARAR
jgi:CheY-like chemotaxis protein